MHSSPSNPMAACAPRARKLWLIGGAAVVAAALGVWLLAFGGRPLMGKNSGESEEAAPQGNPNGLTTVEAIKPRAGGTDRVSIQPGTVEPYESADLYSKVSGFLIQTADIGKRVKKGELLARISVPELDQQEKKDKALVANAEAKVKQMEAHVKAAEADERAARQYIPQAKIEAKSKAAYKSFRGKQLDRITRLYKDNAVEAALVDEEQDRYEAALQAEYAANEAVTTAQAKWEAARAKIAQAEADLAQAHAEVDVATAEWEKSKVFVGYTTITSPYDGVVTHRHYFPGDFIRAADAGGTTLPVISVDRTDKMRVVVQIPDRDVPFVDDGDPADFTIDALPHHAPFKGVVSRSAKAEDPSTRTMRTEVDVDNADGQLRRNMYGRVKLVLQKGSPNALRVPSTAFVTRDGDEATLRVVRDGHVHFLTVETGIDNGKDTEVLTGLKPTDRVIVQAAGPIEEDSEVNVADARPSSVAHH
jgi:HlyD family secretion protein